ncbi:MAG: T9SS type A sorting domain-containing protein [Bacteroidota bacterium]
MKSYAIYFLIFACALHQAMLAQQVDWSPPIQITFGEGDDIHCATNISDFFGRNTAWIGFTRIDDTHKNICLKQLLPPYFVTWSDSVYYLTNDSIPDDYPTLANYGDSLLMVVWQRYVGNWELFYSIKNENSWLTPMQITNDSSDDILPQVYGAGDRCGLVWQRNGRILYSEFINNTWTLPEIVSPDSSTNNTAPQISYIEQFTPNDQPIVIWEKTSLPFHFEYAYRENTIWRKGIIPFSANECKNPKFVNRSFFSEIGISCECLQSNQWEIFSLQGTYSGIINWENESNFSNDTTADDINASFYLCAIITKEQRWFPFIASTWIKKNYFSDSIAVQSFLEDFPKTMNTTTGSTDRNPVIFGRYSRVWSIWENNSTGHWKLYGTTADIPLSVEEKFFPSSFSLSQNYPNPFNPQTAIGFSLLAIGNVTLKIYDLLGREVATLINNETMQSGKHEIQLDGSTLTSGVYFYRLVVGKFSETKKFIITK